ncbi:MAG: hypothetical protein PHG85_03925 [Candidatus Altiarchaeota archaeon]|nr:hypothetical protein [Candidatus Altiarchaeota archaeon]
MIAEKQRGPVRRNIVQDLEKVREWVLAQIRVKQKPELDRNVGDIHVRKLAVKKVITSLLKGAGRSLGKRLGGLRRAGRRITRLFGF